MTVSFNPYPVPLSESPSVFVAALYNRQGQTSTALNNVRVESIHYEEGAVPPSASFSYVLDDASSPPYPTLIADLWPFTAQGNYVVQEDQEILIFEYTPGGDVLLVFDGFAVIPQSDLAGGLSVTFTATGVAVRLWDTVIEGSYWRQGDDPEDGEVVKTDLAAWFNPARTKDGIEPNCTPDGHDVFQGDENEHPVFLDPGIEATTPVQTFWTLGKLARYLMWKYNAEERWFRNPIAPAGGIDAFLKTITPKNQQTYDGKKPSTYTTADIIINNYDASNKPWIEVLAEHLHYHQFEVFFNTKGDASGLPVNDIIIYRKDGMFAPVPKTLNYPAPGTGLGDSLPDVHAIRLARDGHRPANEFRIESDPIRYEVSLILQGLFVVAAADADDANIEGFSTAKLATATGAKRRAYRWFGIDELGQGFWSTATNAVVNGQPFDFDPIFGAPKPPASGSGDPEPQWVRRYRPAKGYDLLKRDSEGHPLRAELAISRTYAGPAPAFWDGKNPTEWRSLGTAGWKLLKDRCGIEITADNPETWSLPRDEDTNTKGDAIRIISSMATPNADDNTEKFYLRLTCVIENDRIIEIVAGKRQASPMRYTVRRSLDAKDHYKFSFLTIHSLNNNTAKAKIVDDDTKKAQAAADAQRLAQEMPYVRGSFTLPWISHAYGVGDLLSKIDGQDIDLNSAAAGPAGQSPWYQTVVAFDWDIQAQTTTLHVSDRRLAPERV